MNKFLKSIAFSASLVLLGATALAGSQYSSYSTHAPSVTQHDYYARQPVYQTVVDAAVASPNLSLLVTALKTAGLVSTLQKGGPFIVFAPTNQAFNQLPPGKLNSLLQPQNRLQLQTILKYHVIPANFSTLQGKTLNVSISRVNQAHIIKTVKTGNGTVYVINQVLLP